MIPLRLSLLNLESIKFFQSSAGRYQKVFKLSFDYGEFDMLVYDEEQDSCSAYEIKHSDKIVDNQYKNLEDEHLCEQTERRFGKIVRKAVIYRGENTALENDIEYINAEEFLENLPLSMDIGEGQGFMMEL